jgi:hypothetical protein
MDNAEWILIAAFLAAVGLVFLRLLAGARRAVVLQAEAERQERERLEAERAHQAALAEIPVTKEVGETAKRTDAAHAKAPAR